jgi:glycosyltransferase involved in cell wall biosynthesis
VWLAKILGVPLFLKVHGSFRETFGHLAPPLSWLRSSLLRNVPMLGVLSQQEKVEFLCLSPRLQKRVRVVKNVIGQEFLNIVRRESAYPTVLFISRFVKMKGPFDLLAAVPLVLNQCATARFVFAGSGPAVEEFLAEVKRRALEKYVAWVGNLDHSATIEYYIQSWVFAFPTHFPEGMPMVIVEAMAAGIPIVTTRTRFSTSYMQEAKHCLFVDHSNPSSLAKAICALLKNPGMRSDFSENNRQFAKQFCLDRVVEEYLAIYSEIVAFQD